ncbi:4-hydroxythreonine-4-phosphate dehydrogenase [Spirochaetia bacterium]|nr:4-hydroxythreonine-4-phosphate dehydrogenase [Spirochaetia bacterium]
MDTKPILGILLGDSAGIGPELVAKSAVAGFLTSVCRPLIIGDIRIFEHALKLIGQTAKYHAVSAAEMDWDKGIPVLDMKDQNPDEITTAAVSADCGRAVLHQLTAACDLCKSGVIKGFTFAPLNKGAMLEGGSGCESEHEFLVKAFGIKGFSGELNVLNKLSTTRVTSHIPLKEVSDHLSRERVLNAIALAYKTVRSFGVETPRIAVAALNPHAGDSGHCGREEIDIIAPAVKEAREKGYGAEGPIPADIIFIKAFAGEFDSVVTMYHDQGQIAMKLKGFEWGITVAGGMPYAITTPAHGTAFDIAGKGIAKTSAFESAVKLAVQMTRTNA